jgi:hypothetical protein
VTTLFWLLAIAQVVGGTEGEAEMFESHARAAADVANHTPFPDELTAVETAWGEPIPSDLKRIGGVDWWSWANVDMTIKDQKPVFTGEYLDRVQRYRGVFNYRHPKGMPMPANPFKDYVMSHLSEDAIIFIKDDSSVPRDYFMLEPANPSMIERR